MNWLSQLGGLLGSGAKKVGGLLNSGVRQVGGLLTPDSALGENLTPEQQQAARRAAYLGFGTHMLNAAGPTTGVAPSLGQAFGGGLLAGRDAYGQSIGQATQEGAYLQQQAEEQERKTGLAELLARYQQPPQAPQGGGGMPTPNLQGQGLLSGAQGLQTAPQGPSMGMGGPQTRALTPFGQQPQQPPAGLLGGPDGGLTGEMMRGLPQINAPTSQVGNGILPNEAVPNAPQMPTQAPQQQQQHDPRALMNDLVANGYFKEAAQLGAIAPHLMPKEGASQYTNLGNRVMERMPDGSVQYHDVGRNPNMNTPRDTETLTAAQRITAERGMRGDFDRATKDWRTGISLIDGALSEAANAKAGDAAATTNMLYAFVKAMDPNSAVREGEIALVRAASSWRQQAERWHQQILSGGDATGMVPKSFIEQMERLMAARQVAFRDNIADSAARYERIAGQAGLSTESQFPVPQLKNYRGDIPLPPPYVPAPNAGGGASATPTIDRFRTGGSR